MGTLLEDDWDRSECGILGLMVWDWFGFRIGEGREDGYDARVMIRCTDFVCKGTVDERV